MKNLIKFVFIFFLIFGGLATIAAQDAEKVFQQAMIKEEGEGNLTEAIEIYTRLADDNSVPREIRANALMHMGICYEKLGKKQASSVYEKLISEYGDQTDLIAVARQKLKSLKGNSDPVKQGQLSQRIHKGVMGGIMIHNVSPDGRYYSFLDTRPRSKFAEEIVRYDFLEGKMMTVTDGHEEIYGQRNSTPWNSIWSPDGKKIAYSYFNNEQDQRRFEIHLINPDGSGKKVLYSEVTKNWGIVHDFSPDGRKVLFSIQQNDNETKVKRLIEVDLASLEDRTIQVFNSSVDQFRYAPGGDYLAYADSDDVYILDVKTNVIEQVTSFDGMDWGAVWSLKGDKLFFISDRQGSNDLFSIDIVKGKPSGPPKVIKRHLGDGAKIMGLDNTGAIYFNAKRSRTDIYTVDLSKDMDIDPSSVKQITPPGSLNSNGLARFSKDGKYISYQSNFTSLNDALRSDLNSKYEGYDEELGWLYAINIYNSETGTTKLLDIPLYLNHYPRSQAWMVPAWSYHGNQLLVHGRIRENFTGGFFLVDVEKETITPALTKPNCKVGMKWNEIEMGNSMFFSKKKDIFYYSAPGWKKAMQYNIKTGEHKTIATIEDGFWFLGFLDQEESKLNAANRLGYFEYDIQTGEKKKYAKSGYPEPSPLFQGETDGFTMWDLEGKIVFDDVAKREDFSKVLKLVFDSGETKEFDLKDLFPECLIRIQDYQPEKNQLLLSVIKNPGREIYKLTNVFE